MDIIAAVRTGVQALVGMLWGIPAVAALIDALGISEAFTTFLESLAIGITVLVLRWLETRLPWLTQILSLGTSKSGPTY